MTRHLDEDKKLAQELSNRKKELKSAMFDDKLASFMAFPSTSNETLGELAFSRIQIPFTLSKELKPIDIPIDFEFVLPLEHGQRIVTFSHVSESKDVDKCFTQMRCFDQLGRLIAADTVDRHVTPFDVVKSGPNEFVAFHYFCGLPELFVYNSELSRVRGVGCKDFSSISCNSKFVFGLWNSDGDDDDGDFLRNEQEKLFFSSSCQFIQVHHLDTLSKAFCLRVPKEYTVARILADEHHLLAMLQTGSKWSMSVFDLATCNQIDGDQHASGDNMARFTLADRHIPLDTQTPDFDEVFLLDGWLVVPFIDEILWFDKEGHRSETSTEFYEPKLLRIPAWHYVVLFAFGTKPLAMRRMRFD